MSGFTELSGKIASTRSRRIWSTSRWTSPAEPAPASTATGSAPTTSTAATLGEVAQCVVGRHDLALRGRHALDAGDDLPVERAELPLDALGVPPVNAPSPPGSSSVRRGGSPRRHGWRCGGPATSAGRRRAATESISDTASASPPALAITSSSHSSTSPPERKTRSALATAATSLRRGSRSCGSPPGRSIPSTETRPPPTWLHEVRRLRGRRDDGPAVAGRRAVAAAGNRPARRQRKNAEPHRAAIVLRTILAIWNPSS